MTYRRKPGIVEAWQISMSDPQPPWIELMFLNEHLRWDSELEGGLYFMGVGGYASEGHWLALGNDNILRSYPDRYFRTNFEKVTGDQA